MKVTVKKVTANFKHMKNFQVKIINMVPKMFVFGIVGLFFFLYTNLDALSLSDFLGLNKAEAISKVTKQDNVQTIKVFEAGKTFGEQQSIGGKAEKEVFTGFAFSGDRDLDGHNKEYEHENISTKNDIATYVVQEGESVGSIARYFGVSIESITTTNKILNNKIKVGQTLEIPAISGINYVVKKGDTLDKIVKKYNVDIDDVTLYNNLFGDDTLSINDEIFLPGAKTLIEDKPVKNNIAVKTNKRWEKGNTEYLNTPVSVNKYASLPKFPDYFTHPSPGATRTQKMHGANSVDLANTKGAPVVASAGGTVRIAKSDGYNFGYGKYIIITHPNGTETLYAHNSELLVNAGQSVSKGQQIAKIGSTGNSTGPHVHFEIRGAYNPFAW